MEKAEIKNEILSKIKIELDTLILFDRRNKKWNN